MGTEMHKSIHVTHGIITYSGYQTCETVANGVRAFGTDGIVPGWHYGLVDYMCDGINGTLVSKMTCTDCGIYCLRNEMIDGCQKGTLPTIIGVVVGMFIAFLTVIVWNKLVLGKLYPRLLEMLQGRRSAKENKRRTEAMNMAMQVRYAAVDSPPEESTPHHTIGIEDMDHKCKEEQEQFVPTVSRVEYRSPLIQLFIIASLLVCASVGCDNTLYISSTGQICEQTHCRSMGMYEMILQTGSVLCFRDTNGEYLKLQLEKAYTIYSSSLVYYTSDYDIEVKHHWECKGAGECWNGGCHSSYKHSSLTRVDKLAEMSGYGCDTDSLGCDTMCWHKTACTYYRWTLHPVGSRYAVYRIKKRGWMATIKVKYLNTTKSYSFNANNPQMEIEQLSIKKMPMIISSVTKAEQIVDNSIIRVGDEFYNINAADINMPEMGVIGDYQISVKNSSAAYNMYNVHCQINSCTPRCKWPEPSIRRVVPHATSLLPLKTSMLGDGRNIISKLSTKMQANILIGNVDIHNLKVSPAHCGISVLTTFGCTGCKLDSYAVLQATNIKDEGLLHFTSDCTFSNSYLSCTSEPYKLVLAVDSPKCTLHIPSTNTTITIDFDFKYLGRLDPSTPIYSDGIEVQDALNLLVNSDMMNAVLGSWVGFSFITLIMSMIIKMARGPCGLLFAGYCSSKASKEVRAGDQ